MDAQAALELARVAARAGAAALDGAVAKVVQAKSSDKDWLTEWDARAEAAIVAALRSADAGVYVLGEEGGASGTIGAGRWLVDPIDGTVNFAHGLPMWAVSVAYEEAGVLQAGVVIAPALRWEFAAARGHGATMNGERIAVSGESDLGRAMLATGFPPDRATSARNNFREFERMQRVAGAVRRIGAASLDMCFVARGWLDGYWEFKLKPWDMAAGAIIIEEAGGRVTAPDGGPFVVDHGESVASNGKIHDAVLAELSPFLPRSGA